MASHAVPRLWEFEMIQNQSHWQVNVPKPIWDYEIQNFNVPAPKGYIDFSKINVSEPNRYIDFLQHQHQPTSRYIETYVEKVSTTSIVLQDRAQVHWYLWLPDGGTSIITDS
jgi:hypothetical protein